MLFNMIFNGTYPTDWCYARFIAIYKKGNPSLPENYRGISILCALCKVYDMVLHRRFTMWYKPTPEQAGAQQGRGCLEQIASLRLIIDSSRKMKQSLYIVFIDFQKAYDRVNRQRLLNLLAEKGCGQKYLKAVTDSLSCTCSLLGQEVVEASSGVRQGGSTSCCLFTFYVDVIVNAINDHQPDAFLENLHCLLLMDDTAVLATSREAMESKLNLLQRSCDEIGMLIHPNKSQFITVCTNDTTPFQLGDIIIRHTESYCYLGTPISGKPIQQQVTEHLKAKQSHVRKYLSFLSKNSDAPFIVKKTVWNAALNSAIFYSAETWFCSNLKTANAPYLTSAKALLGVRTQTSNDLVYLELGVSSIVSLIRSRQIAFLHKLNTNPAFDSSPVRHALAIAARCHSPMDAYIQNLSHTEVDPTIDFMSTLKAKVLTSNTSRLSTYVSINPNLSVHKVYNSCETVPETFRISFTRLRLSSHRLRIETGRWSRTPANERLCSCQAAKVQSEYLILAESELTSHICGLL